MVVFPSVVFTLVYVLGAQEGVQPQLYADNLECATRDPGILLRATRFTTGYVRLVGQEPAQQVRAYEYV